MQAIERLPELVNGNAALVHRGRYFSDTFLVEVGAQPWYVGVRQGRIVAVEGGPFLLRPWRFAVRATAEAWQGFWAAEPAPGFHDIFAICKQGLGRLEGDLVPLMQNLRYVKEVLAAPRAGPGTA